MEKVVLVKEVLKDILQYLLLVQEGIEQFNEDLDAVQARLDKLEGKQ